MQYCITTVKCLQLEGGHGTQLLYMLARFSSAYKTSIGRVRGLLTSGERLTKTRTSVDQGVSAQHQ